MSEESKILEQRLTEVVISLRELTSEIKHLIQGHDETKSDIKELQNKVQTLEINQAGENKIMEIMQKSQDSIKRVGYSIVGAVLTVAIIGGLTFKLAGSS